MNATLPVELNNEFLPTLRRFLKPADREGVYQFVRIDDGIPAARRECFFHAKVPCGAPA